MKLEIACSTNINCVANLDKVSLQFRITVGPNVKLNPARTSPTKPNQTKNIIMLNWHLASTAIWPGPAQYSNFMVVSIRLALVTIWCLTHGLAASCIDVFVPPKVSEYFCLDLEYYSIRICTAIKSACVFHSTSDRISLDSDQTTIVSNRNILYGLAQLLSWQH